MPEFSSLQTRIFSALILLAVICVPVFLGGLWFIALVLIAALLMYDEWCALTQGKNPYLKWCGLIYILAPSISAIILRNSIYPFDSNAGLLLLSFVVLTVVATDIGAYFAGKTIGGAKLWPTISPNKTWAGLGGGVLAACVVGMLASNWSPYPDTVYQGALLGISLALISQAGDMLESWIKRRAGVKDSGTLIPGHGGLLDRLDGHMTAIPVFALLVVVNG